jgi:CheY-like chemotaxis protein
LARVLCVDDEPAVRDVLALHLSRQGYEVEIAPDGLSAWHLITAAPQRFDVVITDNQMPHLTGMQLVERLRASGYPGGIVFFSSTVPASSAARLEELRVARVEKGQPIPQLMIALRRAAGLDKAT